MDHAKYIMPVACVCVCVAAAAAALSTVYVWRPFFSQQKKHTFWYARMSFQVVALLDLVGASQIRMLPFFWLTLVFCRFFFFCGFVCIGRYSGMRVNL